MSADHAPLNRLLHGAANSARASFRGKPTAESEAAVRRALREVTFRFELVTRANVVAHEALDLDAFAYAAFTSQRSVSSHRKATHSVPGSRSGPWYTTPHSFRPAGKASAAACQAPCKAAMSMLEL